HALHRFDAATEFVPLADLFDQHRRGTDLRCRRRAGFFGVTATAGGEHRNGERRDTEAGNTPREAGGVGDTVHVMHPRGSRKTKSRSAGLAVMCSATAAGVAAHTPSESAWRSAEQACSMSRSWKRFSHWRDKAFQP